MVRFRPDPVGCNSRHPIYRSARSLFEFDLMSRASKMVRDELENYSWRRPSRRCFRAENSNRTPGRSSVPRKNPRLNADPTRIAHGYLGTLVPRLGDGSVLHSMTQSPFVHGFLLTLFALQFFVSAAKCASDTDIDSPAYWTKGRESISRLGDGFIVWESLRTDRWRIWTIKLDGSGLHQLTADEPGRDHYAPKINPGGTKMIYLSLSADAATNDRPLDVKGDLHLIDIDGKNDHVIVHGAMKYNGWDRAVVWFDDRTLAYIGPDANTYQLNLDTGASELIIKGRQCWLPNTKRTHAVWSFNTFSIYDAKNKTVSPMPHLGGCQCYFTPDGVWGFWMRAPGGPIYKMFLETRDISPLVDQSLLPPERRFLYFPLVSNDQRLVAFGAAPTARVTDYVHTDYDIFLAPIDPATLEVTGPAVRYTFDPKCDRFPDVYQSPLALGYHTNKVPYDVSLTSAGMTGDWEWRFGDSETMSKAAVGKHTYSQPGTYVVEARQ